MRSTRRRWARVRVKCRAAHSAKRPRARDHLLAATHARETSAPRLQGGRANLAPREARVSSAITYWQPQSAKLREPVSVAAKLDLECGSLVLAECFDEPRHLLL